MIKYIKPQEIIKTEQFIREPVDSLSKEIINNQNKKIIVNGNRGSGKSLVLLNTEDKGLGTNNQTILMHFNSIINFSTILNELFDEKFLNHYYELIFSWQLLSYINYNYVLTYESKFKDIEQLLQSISHNTDDYIRNIYYEKRKITRYLSPKEISSQILKRLKKCMGIKSLSLAIDRFDWINGSNELTQKILSNYFEMFDKTIITTDDTTLEDKKEQLENKGYYFLTTNYGQNVDVIKQIIKKRIKLYNKKTDNNRRNFDENILTEEIYNNLVKKANGNISVILEALEEVADLLDWQDGYVEDIEDTFDSEINTQLVKVRQLKKINANPPTLHL